MNERLIKLSVTLVEAESRLREYESKEARLKADLGCARKLRGDAENRRDAALLALQTALTTAEEMDG